MRRRAGSALLLDGERPDILPRRDHARCGVPRNGIHASAGSPSGGEGRGSGRGTAQRPPDAAAFVSQRRRGRTRGRPDRCGTTRTTAPRVAWCAARCARRAAGTPGQTAWPARRLRSIVSTIPGTNVSMTSRRSPGAQRGAAPRASAGRPRTGRTSPSRRPCTFASSTQSYASAAASNDVWHVGHRGAHAVWQLPHDSRACPRPSTHTGPSRLERPDVRRCACARGSAAALHRRRR